MQRSDFEEGAKETEESVPWKKGKNEVCYKTNFTGTFTQQSSTLDVDKHELITIHVIQFILIIL